MRARRVDAANRDVDAANGSDNAGGHAQSAAARPTWLLVVLAADDAASAR